MSTDSENRRFLVYVQVPAGTKISFSPEKTRNWVKKIYVDKNGESCTVVFLLSTRLIVKAANNADLVIVGYGSSWSLFGFERIVGTKCVHVSMVSENNNFKAIHFFHYSQLQKVIEQNLLNPDETPEEE